MPRALGKQVRYRTVWWVAVGLAVGVVWLKIAPGVQVIPKESKALPPIRHVRIDAGQRGRVELPATLLGSRAPHLLLDTSGHLAKVKIVRDFFDYFLVARSELTSGVLDGLVQREIATQLAGAAAQNEALNAWIRYRAYLTGLAGYRYAGMAAPLDPLNAVAMQAFFIWRDALAQRMLGDWREAFFGAEWRRQRYDWAWLQIARDPSLNDTQKAFRRTEIDQWLAPIERAEQAGVQRQQETLAQVEQWQQANISLDEMRAKVAQTVGPEAAERVVQLQRDNNAWRDKYADYAADRIRIDRANLPALQHDAQIAQLRQRYFMRTADALRAAALDRGGEPAWIR